MKLFLVWALSAFLVFSGFSNASAQAGQEGKKVIEPKEFISEERPAEIDELIVSVGMAFPGEDLFYSSGKVAGVNDYVLKTFITDIGDIVILVNVSIAKDGKGNINPCGCDSKTVAVIFKEQKVSWYRSLEVKKFYLEATK